MPTLAYYVFLAALVLTLINYFELSTKESLILAIVVGGLGGILSAYFF